MTDPRFAVTGSLTDPRSAVRGSLTRSTAHPVAVVLVVLVDGAGGGGCGRLAGGRGRRGVGDVVVSGHVDAQLRVEMGLVDGGQVTPGHHAVGVVHVDEGPHHHGLVGPRFCIGAGRTTFLSIKGFIST